MHYLPTCDTERTSNDKLKRLGLSWNLYIWAV